MLGVVVSSVVRCTVAIERDTVHMVIHTVILLCVLFSSHLAPRQLGLGLQPNLHLHELR